MTKGAALQRSCVLSPPSAYTNNDPVNNTDPTGLCVDAANATSSTRSTQICQPATSLDTSQDGKDAVENNENGSQGPRLTVYKDTAGNDTVGTGHKVTPADNLQTGQTITQTQSDTLFDGDIQTAETTVENLVGNLPVSQEEFDALVDLAFNVGAGNLDATNSPGLNAAIAAGNYGAIANELVYTKDSNGVRQPGLVKRSQRRQNIFRNGNYRRVP
ncbi:MAG: glycoside hydrolase family protein [Alphaproteobacteria bacterium]|nr:glycoside hydrolase family protein [Alphaproteobacteria bacterium]